MNRMIRPALCAGAVALAATLAACQKPAATADAAKVEEGLRAVETQWNADFAAKDAAKLAAHYTDDAVLMSPQTPTWKGMDQIKAGLAQMVADPALNLKFKADHVGVSADGATGWTQGSYTMTATDPMTKKVGTSSGAYLTIYQKQADGTWKSVEDIATEGPPPAAPMAAAPPAKS
jgi:uncharacterized protein (TIGR02246 family)